MPPKAAKKGSAKTGAAVVNKNWEAGLTRAQFEEVCYLTDVFLRFNFIRVFKTRLSSHRVKLEELLLPGTR